MNLSHSHPPAYSQPRAYDISSTPPAPYGPYDEPSPPYTTTPTSNRSPSETFELSPPKRQKLSGPPKVTTKRHAPTKSMDMKSVRAGSVPERGQSRDGQGSTKTTAPPAGAAAGKSRRVRTGCLTCRERHLKCDEGLPDCNNCRKSSRECKRGVRLNFIDTQVKNPAIIPPTADWSGRLGVFPGAVNILRVSMLIACSEIPR